MSRIDWGKWLFDRLFAWDSTSTLFLLFLGTLANFPLLLALGLEDEQCPCGKEVWLLFMVPPLITAYVIPAVYTNVLKRPWGPEEHDGGE